MQVQMYGEWHKCGTVLKTLSTRLLPLCQAKLYENAELVLETMQGHIDKQDLPWAELSEITKRLKEDERIYIETGYLRDNIGIRKIKSAKNGATYFIGASPWKTHPESGRKFSDIMMFMEYGTVTQPPRPLIRPTYKEVQKQIKEEWKKYLRDLVRGDI